MFNDRIVITGMGAVSCDGLSTGDFIENVNANISGIKKCTRYDMSKLKSQFVGEIDYDELYKILPNSDNVEKTVYLAYFAALKAIEDSGFNFSTSEKSVAIVIGSLFGGYNSSTYVHENFLENYKLEDVDTAIFDYFNSCSIPSYLAKKFNIKSIKIVISNACASGSSAVGFACDLIKAGIADMAIAGGADELNRLSLAGFNSLGALAPDNCTPYTNSLGINIGEGAGIFILEKFSDVKERGGIPKVEVIGYELTSDSFHITAPDPNGDGAYRAMKGVLERNGISAEDIAYVNGHGTGTNANDPSEIKAVKRLFADSGKTGKLSSNKGVIGHCMGAAGALELFISAKSVEICKIPPTYHTEKQKELAGISVVKTAEDGPCPFVISNSFAFGGNNVSVGLSSPEYFAHRQLDNMIIDDDVVITGVGCIGNKHTSFQEYSALLERNDIEFAANENYMGKYDCVYNGVIPDYDYRHYMSPDFFRKTDLISKISIISSVSAIKDADIKISRGNAERVGLVYGTGTGPISTIEQLNLDILQKGLAGMNAFFFPNSVSNAAPGYITMNSNIKGTTVTTNGGGATFIANMLYAKLILLQNKADYVIVTLSDDYNEIYHAAYEKLGLLNKRNVVDKFFIKDNTGILSPGSVSLVLERKKTAADRNAKMYAKINGGSMTGDSNSINGLNVKSNAMRDVFEKTLLAAGITIDELDAYFSASTGIAHLDFIEKQKIISKYENVIVSSPRQFCGYNSAIIPAYSTLSAILAFSGSPVYDIKNGSPEPKNVDIKNAMIASYAFGETYGNLIISKI